jgi:hypothetical protein
MMDDFSVLVGILATGSISINLYLVTQINKLCQRISHLEGFLSK